MIAHDPRAAKLPIFGEGLNFPRILTFLLATNSVHHYFWVLQLPTQTLPSLPSPEKKGMAQGC